MGRPLVGIVNDPPATKTRDHWRTQDSSDGKGDEKLGQECDCTGEMVSPSLDGMRATSVLSPPRFPEHPGSIIASWIGRCSLRLHDVVVVPNLPEMFWASPKTDDGEGLKSSYSSSRRRPGASTTVEARAPWATPTRGPHVVAVDHAEGMLGAVDARCPGSTRDR